MDLFRVTIPPSPLELQHMGLGASGPVGPGFAADPVAASARLAGYVFIVLFTIRHELIDVFRIRGVM